MHKQQKVVVYRTIPNVLIRALSLIIFLVILFGRVSAAEQSINADSLFYTARDVAASEDYPRAINLCQRILDFYPDYHDARILLGRIYGWQERYALAEQELLLVKEKVPDRIDGLTALVDIYLWSGQYQEMLEVITPGLRRFPDNPDLLYKQSIAYNALGRTDDAINSLEQLLSVQPNYSQGKTLYSSLVEDNRSRRITLRFRYDHFSDANGPVKFIPGDESGAPWRFGILENIWETNNIAFIGRLNYAGRIGRQEIQVEADLYPELAQGTYAYVNFGYSGGRLFPDIRAGTEVYQALLHQFEASLGIRYLDFGQNTITMGTGSLGAYFGNYFLQARAFLSESSFAYAGAWLLQIRRYLSSSENYLSIFGGVGPSPDQPTSQQEYVYRSAHRLGFNGQHVINERLLFEWQLLLANEEWSGDTYKTHATITAGLGYKY